MPGLYSSVQCFDRASGLPDDVWRTLRAHAVRANTILPHAEKVFPQFPPVISSISSNEQLWLVYKKPGTSSIAFILSCTENTISKYPLFIVPTVPTPALTHELLQDSMKAFCNTLLNRPGFSRRRVFSIFSIHQVSEAFSREWTIASGISRLDEPYYNSFLSTCSISNLIAASSTTGIEAVERPANKQDTQRVAKLCQEFAATGPPFLLSPEKASEEANILIENKQVWVLEIESDIASIVAVTRKSESVATITKVYTPEKWRGRRFAERLVRHVCTELLKKHEQVALYVGVNLHSAKSVYRRVGFQGLTEEPTCERWVEIGFDPAEVDLGHW